VGRKILQYCLQNMGGTHLRCFDLAADAPTAKSRKVFDDLEEVPGGWRALHQVQSRD